MPDYVSHATVRMRTKYRAFGREHAVTLRYARGTSGSTAQTLSAATLGAITALFAASGELAEDFEFLQADYSPEDDPLFYPAATLPAQPTGTVLANTISPLRRVVSTTWPYRGTTSKGRIVLYGIDWSLDDDAVIAGDGKVTAGEDTQVASSLGEFDGIVAIDNTAGIFYSQVTVKVNDYWLSQLRRGL